MSRLFLFSIRTFFMQMPWDFIPSVKVFARAASVLRWAWQQKRTSFIYRNYAGGCDERPSQLSTAFFFASRSTRSSAHLLDRVSQSSIFIIAIFDDFQSILCNRHFKWVFDKFILIDLHLWIVMQFCGVPLDRFYALFAYLDRDALIYLDTVILKIRHSIWIVWRFVPILPLQFAMLSSLGFLCAVIFVRMKRIPIDIQNWNLWFFSMTVGRAFEKKKKTKHSQNHI